MDLGKRVYDDYVWGLKHRPDNIDDMVLPKNLELKFKKILNSGNIGNMLFSGNAGLGKTTVAYIISNTLDRDTKYINASMKTSIEVIRGELEDYCSSSGWDENTKKLVILDEMESMSVKAEKALKVFIETFGAVCDFIFITNFKFELSDAIMSRLQDVEFIIPPDEKKTMMKKFAHKMVNIFNAEGIEYEKNGIVALMQQFFPDMRLILNEAQNLSDSGSITADRVNQMNFFDIEKYFEYIKLKNFAKTLDMIVNLNMRPDRFFQKLFDDGLKYITDISRAEFILQLSEYMNRSTKAADPTIHITAFSVYIMSNIALV